MLGNHLTPELHPRCEQHFAEVDLLPGDNMLSEDIGVGNPSFQMENQHKDVSLTYGWGDYPKIKAVQTCF